MYSIEFAQNQYLYNNLRSQLRAIEGHTKNGWNNMPETGHKEFYNNRMRQIRHTLKPPLVGKLYTGSHLNRPSSAGSNYIISEISKLTN